MTNHVRDFIKELNQIRYSKNGYELFNDFLTLTAATLYLWKKDKKVEEEYMSVANQYTKEELLKFGKLFDITIDALTENQEQDFLGDVFQFGEYNNGEKGQFFTPYHLTRFMAEALIGKEKKDRMFRLTEPSCGSGAMMIAAANVLKKRGFNYQVDSFFVGIDIDPRCARMAYIQCSLLSIPAVIVCGNALSNEVFWERETFMFFMTGMRYRLKAEDLILEREKEMSKKSGNEEMETMPEQTIIKEIKLPPARKQGELF